MDPTAVICRVRDSFTQPLSLPDLPEAYTGAPAQLRPELRFTREPNLPCQYADAAEYAGLQTLKDQFTPHSNEALNKARARANPHERIGSSIFMDRAGVKLANIDAVYHLVDLPFSLFQRQHYEHAFHFLDLAGGPGAFSQYLLWRYPASRVTGMTLRTGDKLDWNMEQLGIDHFTAVYGGDETGDLYTNWAWLLDYETHLEAEGFDAVLADGGIDIGAEYRRQEVLSSRLLLSEAVVGIGRTKPGGAFVLKVFDTVTSISAQTIYLLSCCFERVSLFKPISSRPANAESYLICQRRRAQVEGPLSLGRAALTAWAAEPASQLAQLFPPELMPVDFQSWLVAQNQLSIHRQIEHVRLVLLALAGSPLDLPQLDLRLALAAWAIPDNPQSKPRR